MRINNNVAAFNANRNLASSNMSLGKSLEKLSSGFRINRAGDDAAGLVISQGLRAQASGLQQATRNAQDGISVVQTAEGALTEVHSMLNRMRDLAVQSANTGSNDSNAVAASQAEYDELSSEITRIADSTKFGSKKLLDGNFGKTAGTASGFVSGTVDFGGDETFTVSVAGGSGAVSIALDDTGAMSGSEAAAYLSSKVRAALEGTGNSVDATAATSFKFTSVTAGGGSVITAENSGSTSIALADTANAGLATDLGIGATATVAAATGTGGDFQVGANNGETINVAIGAMDASTLGIDGANLGTSAGATIDLLDTAIASVSTLRGELGAKQNRFESTINNLQVSTENIVASESRIRDTDMATEMTNFTKQQILQQAGTAMLGQANSLPQGVLRLLG